MSNYYYYIIPQGKFASRYASIHRESEEDPGRVLWALYSSRNKKPDSAYVDGNYSFISMRGNGYMGMEMPKELRLPESEMLLATITPNTARRVQAKNAVIAPLSVFDVVAKDLINIHALFIDLDDIDYVWLVINNSFYERNKLHELLPLMSAIKKSGFTHICLGSFGELNNDFTRLAYQKLYRPLGLELGRGCPEIKHLTAQTKSASAYDLMKNQKFTKDIDRVLREVAARQNTGDEKLGGRRGKPDGEGDGLAGLLQKDGAGENANGNTTKAKGNVKTLAEKDIKVISGGRARSAADIMKVVRQRIPGLRHIYNKFLKRKPGFQGKVALKFTIAPGGEISSISVDSSTTGYGEFDAAIKEAVSRWPFDEVKSGNTTVTIPFAFSE